MADQISEFRNTLMKAMEKAVTAALSGRGTALGTGAYPGSFTRPVGFATGYDGAETTMSFMLDHSLLDGPDVLMD